MKGLFTRIRNGGDQDTGKRRKRGTEVTGETVASSQLSVLSESYQLSAFRRRIQWLIPVDCKPRLPELHGDAALLEDFLDGGDGGVNFLIGVIEVR